MGPFWGPTKGFSHITTSQAHIIFPAPIVAYLCTVSIQNGKFGASPRGFPHITHPCQPSPCYFPRLADSGLIVYGFYTKWDHFGARPRGFPLITHPCILFPPAPGRGILCTVSIQNGTILGPTKGFPQITHPCQPNPSYFPRLPGGAYLCTVCIQNGTICGPIKGFASDHPPVPAKPTLFFPAPRVHTAVNHSGSNTFAPDVCDRIGKIGYFPRKFGGFPIKHKIHMKIVKTYQQTAQKYTIKLGKK